VAVVGSRRQSGEWDGWGRGGGGGRESLIEGIGH
jgi:hypothetical protein